MTITALSTAATTRLPPEPRLHRASPPKSRVPRRLRIRLQASRGRTTPSSSSPWAATSRLLPASHAPRDGRGVLAHRRAGAAQEPRHGLEHREQHQRHHGDRHQHPQGDERARPRLERPVLRRVPVVGQQPEQGRPDPVVEVGHPRQVGEQVVAVEAQQRQQLLRHLQDLGGDQQQQRLPPRRPPPGEREHHDDRVEVEPPEVRPDPARPAEPVAVGHVGVEGRPDEVQARPHDAGLGTAVAGCGGVPELVEAPGQHGHHEHEQQQVRPLEGVVRRGAEAPLEEHPADHQHEAEEHGRAHHRPEQHPERVGQPVGGGGVGDGHPELERQQRVRAPDLGLRAVGAPEQAERPQVAVDQRRDVGGAHVPAQPTPDHLGDLGAAAAAVDGVEDQVQQGRELQDLAIRPPDERGRLPIARSHHLADELDAVDAGGSVDQRGHCPVLLLGAAVAVIRDRLRGAPAWDPA